MRERKDINYGADIPPERLWAAYRQETNALVVAVLTPSRIRIPPSPEDELALDG